MTHTVGAYTAAGKHCILAVGSVHTVEAVADMIELEGIVQLEDTVVPGCIFPVVGRVEVGGTAELAADVAEAVVEDTVQSNDVSVDTAAADTAEMAAEIAEVVDTGEAAGTVELVDAAEPAGSVETIE